MAGRRSIGSLLVPRKEAAALEGLEDKEEEKTLALSPVRLVSQPPVPSALLPPCPWTFLPQLDSFPLVPHLRQHAGQRG